MLKYTTYNLKKIQTILEEIGYKVRYEKGHFQSGYCIVKNSRVVVINKFYDTEARINCMIEILKTIEVDETTLDNNMLKFYKKIIEEEN